MIALMSPEDSWVAKWQRINRFTKGIYAISVAGKLPNGVIRDLKSRGIIYKPRDTSLR
ncbi:Transcription elongation factor SPT4 [Homalodisca vitripennis]|nr:Transcription elongation factor SPT4 [Homalodisca vitripennis]KAG8334868.1 Transcription elongation factor SPT4 [Homalodisca vitripennis]